MILIIPHKRFFSAKKKGQTIDFEERPWQEKVSQRYFAVAAAIFVIVLHDVALVVKE